TNKNQLVHERKQSTGKEIGERVVRYIKELEGIEERKITRLEGNEEWNPSTNLLIKINFDASFNQTQARPGLGIVARNALGIAIRTIVKALSSDSRGRCKDNNKKKSTNALAHCLATESLNRDREDYLEGGVPDFIVETVGRRRPREPDWGWML
ncbi:hypothetical protein Goshw_018666, partial [Gossypium schwendimanii]|nr:hypothetical protein [Gossypium schwendimanii]